MPPPELRVKRVFVQAVYESDGGGLLRPQMPVRCPFAADRRPCRFQVNHYRKRKTGPCHSIAVVCCSVHPEHCFALYPPAHVAYGRKPVAPQDPGGGLYVDSDTGEPCWGATLFSAATDTSKEVWWHEESVPEDARRRRTQGRRLEWAGQVLGVHPLIEEPLREQIATCLGVPLLTLQEASEEWQRPWQSRGEAVVAVLEAIPVTGSLPDRILAAGAAAGLWPEPIRWRGQRSLHRCSEVPEHVAMPDTGDRAPPPTT